MLRVGAVQLEPVIGDVDTNLDASQRLVHQAAQQGAQWELPPAFFTTGMGFLPELATAAQPLDGPAVAMMQGLARELDITLGGCFLCADTDGGGSAVRGVQPLAHSAPATFPRRPGRRRLVHLGHPRNRALDAKTRVDLPTTTARHRHRAADAKISRSGGLDGGRRIGTCDLRVSATTRQHGG
jgi:predicted amidohydrolase